MHKRSNGTAQSSFMYIGKFQSNLIYISHIEEYDPLKGMDKQICMYMLERGYPKAKPKEIWPSFYNWKKEWERKQEQ